MASALNLVAFVACIGWMAAGCSTSLRSEPQKPPLVRRSVPPRVGVPINPMGATVHFFEQTSHLIAEGKVKTNLIPSAPLKACSLALPQSSGRTITAAELAMSVEQGVAVVGQVVRMEKGAPQLMPRPVSGFFLTESGALVTCLHVLDTPYVIGLVVMTRDGRVCPVREVLAVDATNDLVIVQVEGQGFTPVPVAAAVAAQGESVWVFSHPEFRYYTFSSGIVSGYFRAGDDDVLQMQVTAEFANGSSGAPAFNERGEVVGIAKLTQHIRAETLRPGEDQMVWRVCTPSSALWGLIQKE